MAPHKQLRLVSTEWDRGNTMCSEL